MSSLKNKVQLIGHLGANPEIKTTENGKTLARFSIATNERYKNAQGEKVENTQWHLIVAWGKTADLAEKFLQKGSQTAIAGKLINRSYEGKDGAKRYVTEVVADELLFLDNKN
ncbi:MAG: single-stranded DNA-binding protein [Vicingaceae bacterium]